MEKIDISGQKFGRLLALYPTHKGRRTAWKCICDCGSEVIVTTDALRANKSKSCGCYAKERARDANIKHNKRYTRLYSTFARMKQRCYNKNNPKYKNYGGRGIQICQEWLDDFDKFYDWSLSNGYSEILTIDRINVNGNYEPSNCRWVDMKEQSKNRTTNIVVKYNGESKVLSEWCSILNLDYKLVNRRINDGWNVEDAFFKPRQKQKKIQ